MLVLSREVSQEIIIERGTESITVTLVRINSDACRIGIDAPQDWNIRRSELERIDDEEDDSIPPDLGPWGNV